MLVLKIFAHLSALWFLSEGDLLIDFFLIENGRYRKFLIYL